MLRFKRSVLVIWMIAALVILPTSPAYGDVRGNPSYYLPIVMQNSVLLPSWQITTVDAQSHTGYSPAMAVLNGAPAISYYDYTRTQMKFTRAKVAIPSRPEDWVTMIVADGSGISSLVVAPAGKPTLCFGISSISYATSSSATPNDTADWVTHTVSDTYLGEYGGACSLAFLPDGRPAISYWDMNQTALKFAVARTLSPSQGSDWDIQTIAAVGGTPTSSRTSLAVVGGMPAISYVFPGGGLKYARANSALPASPADWTTMTVAGGAAARIYNRLKVMPASGLPVIAFTVYEHFGAMDYHFHPVLARATSVTPSSSADWSAMIADSTAQSDQGIDVTALPGGEPGLVYHDNNVLGLIFNRALKPAPQLETDWKHMRVDPVNSFYDEVAMVTLPGGQPAVAYHEINFGVLKFAIGWDTRGLQQPTSVSATVGSPTDRVVLRWNLPAGERPSGYKIYRASSQNGSYTLLTTVGDQFLYEDQTVSSVTRYGYQVVAVKPGFSDSSRSTAVMGTTNPWLEMRLDPRDNFGTYPRMVLASDGKPGAVYVGQDTLANQVYFARALTALPSSPADWAITQVGSGAYGHHPALVYLPGDIPLIAYHENSTGSLILVRASKKDPATLADWESVNLGLCAPEEISMLLMPDGKPALSYMDTGSYPNRNVIYRRATATAGALSSWTWQVETLENAGQALIGPDMTLLSSGEPVVCYEQNSGTHTAPTVELRCGVHSSGGWTYAAVDQPGTKLVEGGSVVNSFSVMAQGDFPVVTYTSYAAATSSYIFHMARALKTTPVAQADWVVSDIDSSPLNAVGYAHAARMLPGGAVVAYGLGGILKYAVAKSTTPAGPADWTVTIGSDQTIGLTYISLAYLVDGRPGLAYFSAPEYTTYQLYFTRLAY